VTKDGQRWTGDLVTVEIKFHTGVDEQVPVEFSDRSKCFVLQKG
jgi:hypothetical protein